MAKISNTKMVDSTATITTIKVSEDTKKRLSELDLAGKGKTFDMLINDLITNYEQKNDEWQKNNEKNIQSWKKDNTDWKNQFNEYIKNKKKYDKEQKTWNNLVKWAKTQGFKG